MKNKALHSLGKGLMKLSPIKVIIIDDVGTYFNEQMLSVASANGNITFERYRKCDSTLLKSLVSNPRDILIMDIKGTVTKDVGKDGFDVTKYVFENTNTFVVITSAHKHHLKNQKNYGDYVIVDRLLTPIDFCEEMNEIIDIYLKRKISFYKKLSYKIGKSFIRKKLLTH
ncbi:hypothetical protein [Polaribacter porphyrae]|uniref:Response regulatory domain-containing protein n=1 Tax=Polaribacter porphyrae TaxID=1137780 RepID=A0A2S7WLM2_9FLAO|nr:hypothetical protein [Polaribacter porphyrae]PQJ78514.1 hypothetical protein BTO18_04630 [Polaribacter porphyrae]